VTYDIVFIVASVVAIVAALTVVLSGNPFISSLSLIANLIALATFYLLLQSDFLAAAQVIVYAGAVMIMFLFVTAYLGGRADEPTRQRPVWQTLAALVAAAGVAAEIVFGVGRQSFLHGPVVSDAFGAPQAIAGRFLGRYLLAFVGTSILLLIAAVGGVVLATRRPAPRGADEPGVFEVRRPEPVPSLQSSVMDRETRFDVVRTGAGSDDEKADG
jgi:NADH:ubiquinone oxidoreductase subunit 6 (subunit J)